MTRDDDRGIYNGKTIQDEIREGLGAMLLRRYPLMHENCDDGCADKYVARLEHNECVNDILNYLHSKGVVVEAPIPRGLMDMLLGRETPSSAEAPMSMEQLDIYEANRTQVRKIVEPLIKE